jgi:transposase-like protein
MEKSRRTFTAEFKAKVAIEAIKEIKTVSAKASSLDHLSPEYIDYT